MSLKIEGIKKRLDKRFKAVANQTFYGLVEEVDETMRTCKVKIGGISYEDVLLYAVVKDALKGFVALPVVGSKVLVSRVAGGDRLFVAMYSAVERIKYLVGDVEVVGDVDGCRIMAKDSKVSITPAGITVVRGGSGLKKTFETLIDAIAKLTVSTAVGPSGVPINVADFIKIKEDLNNYLEG